MNAPARAMTAAALALAGAIFLVLAAPADAKPHRLHAAVAEFRQLNPCPANGRSRGACPGYVVDYVVPLCGEGEDAAANLQWLTVRAARSNGNWERQYCQFRRARARAES